MLGATKELPSFLGKELLPSSLMERRKHMYGEAKALIYSTHLSKNGTRRLPAAMLASGKHTLGRIHGERAKDNDTQLV